MFVNASLLCSTSATRLLCLWLLAELPGLRRLPGRFRSLNCNYDGTLEVLEVGGDAGEPSRARLRRPDNRLRPRRNPETMRRRRPVKASWQARRRAIGLGLKSEGARRSRQCRESSTCVAGIQPFVR